MVCEHYDHYLRRIPDHSRELIVFLEKVHYSLFPVLVTFVHCVSNWSIDKAYRIDVGVIFVR
jgi:hypothetical protein